MPNNILITPGSASIQFSGSAANTIRLQVEPSGSIAFYGNSGSLFGISDSLSGSLMSVNDISGLPILEVFSDDRVVMGSFNRNTLVVTGSRVAIDKAVPTTDLDISGSVFITGSLSMNSGGITGSLFGTSSWATNATQLNGSSSATFATTGSNTFVGNQIVTGSLLLSSSATVELTVIGNSVITGSLNVTTGVTSSLFGTASWATTALTASSFTGYLTFPNGLDITGSLFVTGSEIVSGSLNVTQGITGSLFGTSSQANTASVALTALSATSASFSTTSSFASTAQTVTSASYAATASLLLGSVVSASYALSASYAPGGAGLSGGATNYIPLWTSATAQSSSIIYQSSSRNIIIGDTETKHPTNPPLLEINAASGETDVLHLHGQVNDVFQFNIKNYTSGDSASAEIRAIADAGTSSVSNYISFGVNSVSHADSSSVGGPLDAYLFNTGSDLLIGNISPDKRIILFNGGNRAEENARVYIDATGSVGINTAVTNPDNPESLIVRAIANSYNLIRGEANFNSYAQLNMQNTSDGTFASSDIVATSNNGTETINYIDMGINSGQYSLSSSVGGPNDAYLYSTGNDLLIGNATSAKRVVLFAGGADAAANQRFVLTDTNNHNLTGSLQVTGAVTASFTGSLTGTLIGTASWAETSSRATTSSFAISSSYALTSSYSISSSYALSSSFAISSSRTVTSSYAITASFAPLAATASYFAGYALFSNGLDVTGSLVVTGSLITTGSVQATAGFTGSLLGTASNAVSASWAPGGTSGLTTKAGSIANTSFAGNPRKAAVNFSTPFANTNYAIVITGEDARSWTYEGKVVGGFTASSNSNTSLTGTTTWIATAYGET